MASNVGVNVTINNDCRACCPRVLRVFGCCVGKPIDKKVNDAAKVAFEDAQSSFVDDNSAGESVSPTEVKDLS